MVGVVHTTATIAGVITTTGTLLRIPLVELAVRAAMFGRAVLTHIRVRRTLVAIPIRTTILTLLGIQPVVVLADKHIVAHTLDVAVGASLDTLTVLAHAGLARGVTAVVTARPGMVGAVVFAVTAVVVSVVPARAVALVLTKLTIVAVSRLGVTVEAATQPTRIHIVTLAIEAIRTTAQGAELGIHTSSVTVGVVALAVLSVVTTVGTWDGVPFVKLTVITTVPCRVTNTLILVRLASVAVAVGAAILTVLGVVPGIALADEHVVSDTHHRAIGTSHNTLATLTVVVIVAATILCACPIVKLTCVFTVSAVIVRTTSVTVVLTHFTNVALAAGLVTTITTAQLIGLSIAIAVTVQVVVFTTFVAVLGVHTGMVTGLRALTVTCVVTTRGTVEREPLQEHTVASTVFGHRSRTLVGSIRTLVAVAIGTTILTLFRVDPGVVGANKHIIADTLQSTVGTGHHTLTILAVVVVVATAVLRAGPSVFGAVVFTIATVVVRTALITVVLS